jgi:UDP-N-acetylmuramoyl-tripeptide--D-alanyl-D-alanine ligase
MMRLSEAAQALGCEWRGEDLRFESVGTDSRNIVPGSLFVALRGERFDGHAFASEALSKGAVAVMVEEGDAEPALVVPDTLRGLGGLAAHWRGLMSAKIAAVTGSNGKTTVKEMLAGILRTYAGSDVVHVTPGNLNNAIGVPLTLLSLRPQHRYAVVEMGMSRPGEIAYLAGLVHPDVALVNNAQAAHLEGMGSIEAVAREKGSIYEGLQENGVAVINADEACAGQWQNMAKRHRQLSFGFGDGEVRGCYELTKEGSRICLSTPEGDSGLYLRVPGEHNARNALAAAAMALALQMPIESILSGLAEFSGVPGRLVRKSCLMGGTLIDDSYNANPGSVLAAIRVLAACSGTRILVLGDMGELGERAERLHEDIGRAVREAGIDRLLALGELTVHAVKAFGAGGMHFERIEELLAEIENALAPDVTVLVKGSRFMKMERVVQSFEEACPA